MSTTLNVVGGTTVTLPDPAAGPEGCSVEEMDQGAFLQMADGSVVYDWVNTRYRWKLYWSGINAANLATIADQVHIQGEKTFSPPINASTYTVFVVPGSLIYETFETGQGVTYYNVNLQVEETS